MAGGELHVQVKPASKGGVRAWNVHAHMIVELRPKEVFDESTLAAAWRTILAAFGVIGSFDCRPVTSHWAIRIEP